MARNQLNQNESLIAAKAAQICKALLVLLVLPPTLLQAQFDYTQNEGGITITGYYGPGGTVIVPDTIDGLRVTSIGDHAFYVDMSLLSIVIPDGVTNIGVMAFFSDYYLKSISLPDSVKNIGDSAFGGCTALLSVKIPSSVTIIPFNGFVGCYSLTNLIIPDSVGTISGYAFDECTNLTSVRIPNSVTNIGSFAFAGTGLTSLAIPDSVATIEDEAFYHCRNLTNITIGSGVTGLPLGTFMACGKLTRVSMGESVTSIGNHAFSDCTNLATLTFPPAISYVGSFAFGMCANLRAVFFKGNAPNVGHDVFAFDNSGSGEYATTVYYLPGTTGWGATLAGAHTVLWDAQVQRGGPSFGVHMNQFGFTVTATSDLVLVVEACTNLSKSAGWFPVSTNTITGGSSYFSDPEWTNYPAQFYRLRWP